MRVLNLKYICDENGIVLRNENGWPLCQIHFDNGSTDLQYICEVDEQMEGQDENAIDQTENNQIFDPNQPSTSYAHNDNFKLIWTDDATKYLLDQYQQKFSMIGPLKPYKLKRDMWDDIAKDLGKKLGFKCSGTQCENHYKSVIRAYNNHKKKNQTSGNTRHKFPWENEVNAIKALDESIDPEILIGVGKEKVVKKHSEDTKIEEKKKKRETKEMRAIDVWYKAFKKREKNKDRRHREKMKLKIQMKKSGSTIKLPKKKPKKNVSSSSSSLSSNESSRSSTS